MDCLAPHDFWVAHTLFGVKSMLIHLAFRVNVDSICVCQSWEDCDGEYRARKRKN